MDRQPVIPRRTSSISAAVPLYTHRLAERGFRCTGVDFSPVSVSWARQQAQNANLNIDYIQQDIRAYWPDRSFDFIMMTFGELNVFSTADARLLVSRCALGWSWVAGCSLKSILSKKLSVREWLKRAGNAVRMGFSGRPSSAADGT